MACETLLLTDRASVAALGHIGLEEGVHFVSYGDADKGGVRDQSAFLLNHPDELASIASRPSGNRRFGTYGDDERVACSLYEKLWLW